MLKIICVCLGNICRSPAAEGILRKQLSGIGYRDRQEYHLDSAGTGNWHTGEGPDYRAEVVCRQHGVDISHLRARTLTPDDGDNFDLILAMDKANIDAIKQIISSKHYHKIQLFSPDSEIGDPYYGEQDEFETMFVQLSSAASEWLEPVVLTTDSR